MGYRGLLAMRYYTGTIKTVYDVLKPREQGTNGLEAYPVTGISPTCFTGTDDFDDLTSAETIVPSNRVGHLDSRELSFLKTTDVGGGVRQWQEPTKTVTYYFSSKAFFSSADSTSCLGTRVWWVILTRRSASENSSRRNWAAIATITCEKSMS